MALDAVPVSFGKVLRRIRKKAELSQEELALGADIQRNFVSLLELGKKQPTITTLFKLAVALKCNPATIVQMVADELQLKETGSNKPTLRKRQL